MFKTNSKNNNTVTLGTESEKTLFVDSAGCVLFVFIGLLTKSNVLDVLPLHLF
jgi:hypothetical protein